MAEKSLEPGNAGEMGKHVNLVVSSYGKIQREYGYWCRLGGEVQALTILGLIASVPHFML